MVQNFGRVVVAVAALNAAVTLAQSQTNSFELEAREEVPYTRRHFTREELVEFDARELADLSELEAREPEPLHIPFVSNWNAGRKQRNEDRKKGKEMRVKAEQGGGLSERDLDGDFSEIEAREEFDDLEAREDFEDLEAREEFDELEAREPEPEPLHVPFFSNWNAGRKQRNADRKRGKQERVQAEKGAEAGATPERRELNELDAREFDMEELEAREPEPDPLHVPFFSNWNAGRKQRNADKKRGKQERVQAEKSSEAGATERRELDSDLLEFEAREYDVELEAREPEPLHVPFFSNRNAGRKQRNEDRKKGKEERLQAEQSAGITRREFDGDLNEFDARSVEFELDELD